MAIWIDPPRWPAHGRLWSHLVSDTDYAELHVFARANGIPARGFEGDHYDVPQERYAALVAAGAGAVEGRELVRILLASGLRFRKRRGERPLASYRDALHGEPSPHRLDVVASGFEPPDESTVAAAVFMSDAAGSLVLVHTPAREAWGAPAGGREPQESVREGAVREVWEEAGLQVSPGALVPCGYERISFDAAPPGGRWPHRRNHVAVFTGTVEGVAPPLQPQLPDVDAAEWVSSAEAERRCHGAFWWPLLAYVLGPQGIPGGRDPGP